MSWQKAYEKIKPYMIRIESESGFGTGFLFAYTANNSLVAFATACHVVEDVEEWKKPLKIKHYASEKTIYLESKDRVILIDKQRDTATILVRSDVFDLPKVTLPLLPPDKVKKVGVSLGWTGFPSLSPQNLCFFSGVVSFYNLADESYLIDGVAINGVSGGPVFSEFGDSPPQIVGVISAYISNRRDGGSLPGLLKAQDLAILHKHISSLKSFNEAKQEKSEIQGKLNDENETPTEPARPQPIKPPKKEPKKTQKK